MKKTILRSILAAIFLFWGIIAFQGFMENHSYYYEMLKSNVNRGLLVAAGFSAAIPVVYNLLSTQKKRISSAVISLAVGLGVFGIAHATISGGLLNLWAAIRLLFNFTLFFGISLVSIWGLFALGNLIMRKFIKNRTANRENLILNFWVGLVSFLIGMQILMAIHLVYRPIVLVVFLGSGVLIWKEKNHLIDYKNLIERGLENFSIDHLLKSPVFLIVLLLILISVGYYYFGFSHSYIPYPTARDANHEYMYIPKIISENWGILRWNQGSGWGMPYLWHWFIVFFFSLGIPLQALFSIAPDTLAINMNFLSGIFVLILGLAVSQQVIQLFLSQKNKKSVGMLISWAFLLLRLSSGMGAFLVFVDNKTDLWVLTLTLLALFAGFLFIQKNQEKNQENEKIKEEKKEAITILEKEKTWASTEKLTTYLLISGLFFSFATMAKPTAFIDVIVFAMILVGLWINSLTSAGVGITIIWAMGILQPLFASRFISPSQGKRLIGIWIILPLIGVIIQFLKNKGQTIKAIKQILFWSITVIGGLFIFKGPWIAINQITQHNFQLWTRAKSTLLAQNNPSNKKNHENNKNKKPLFAQENTSISLEEQNRIDTNYLNNSEWINKINFDQCKNLNYTADELSETMQKAPWDSMQEDVWRYIGYGRKDFSKTGNALGSTLLRRFSPKQGCYALDADTKILCENQEAIDTFDAYLLKELYIQKIQNQEGQAAILLKSGLDTRDLVENKNESAALRDAIVQLRQYYQSHSIFIDKDTVSIPYRYLVPRNVVFNRSLQNLSSYYTDIGFIRFFVQILVVTTLIVGLLRKNNNLTTLSLATLVGWIVWRIIGGGIVWYGLGLIIRSILVISCIISDEIEEKSTEHIAWSTFLWVFGILIMIQLLFNGIRIASQHSGGPFEQYKSSIGEHVLISDQLEIQKKIKTMTANDIFELQFGSYSPFIEAMKKRTNEEGILIAGTYLQYFLKNQRNLKLDWMLTRFWEQVSDFDTCRSYHRLKNNNLKYLVIDPNIWTVGMGEGNESLFHRFFAKLNPSGDTIETEGAISMLIKLYEQGYLKLFYTNNIWAKYAFTLSDEEINQLYGGGLSQRELSLVRSKMAIAKYFGKEYNQVIIPIIQAFQNRIITGKGIEDIANTMGKKLDNEKLLTVLEAITKQNNPSNIIEQLQQLNQDEKKVLLQYFGIYEQLLSGQQTEAEKALLSIIQESLFWGSQLIILELK